MTWLIKLEHQQPIGHPVAEDNFRQLFPNTSFSRPLTADAVEPFGYGIFDFSNKPESTWLQKVVEIAPVRDNFGIWRQTWNVVNLTGDELAQAESAQQQHIKRSIVQATQDRLDAFARTRQYDDIKSACTYAGCSVPKFNTEGSYCQDRRAETWQALYDILAEVQAGTRPMPSSFADIEPELPALVWPTP
jgi:hypothetical protein